SAVSASESEIITLNHDTMIAEAEEYEASERHIRVHPEKMPIVHPGPAQTMEIGGRAFSCRYTSLTGSVGPFQANTWYDFAKCNSDEFVAAGGAECTGGPLRAIHASTYGKRYIAIKCHNS